MNSELPCLRGPRSFFLPSSSPAPKPCRPPQRQVSGTPAVRPRWPGKREGQEAGLNPRGVPEPSTALAEEASGNPRRPRQGGRKRWWGGKALSRGRAGAGPCATSGGSPPVLPPQPHHRGEERREAGRRRSSGGDGRRPITRPSEEAPRRLTAGGHAPGTAGQVPAESQRPGRADRPRGGRPQSRPGGPAARAAVAAVGGRGRGPHSPRSGRPCWPA